MSEYAVNLSAVGFYGGSYLIEAESIEEAVKLANAQRVDETDTPECTWDPDHCSEFTNIEIESVESLDTEEETFYPSLNAEVVAKEKNGSRTVRSTHDALAELGALLVDKLEKIPLPIHGIDGFMSLVLKWGELHAASESLGLTEAGARQRSAK